MEAITWPSRQPAPLRPAEQALGYAELSQPRVLAGRDHGYGRGLAAAERRVTGGTGRKWGWRSATITATAANRPRRVPDPGSAHGKNAGQRGARRDGCEAWVKLLRRRTAIVRRRPAGEAGGATAGPCPRSADPYPHERRFFEATVTDVCDLVHAAGGQCYVDGRNLKRHGGPFARPGRFRGRCLPPQNCTSVLHPATAAAGPGWGLSRCGSNLAPVPARQRRRPAPSARPANARWRRHPTGGGILPISWATSR